MTTARPRPVRLVAFSFFALLFAVPGLFAQSTWSTTPVDNNWNTAANWSTGTVPAGNTGVAIFGESTHTSVLVNFRLLIGTLQIDAAASAPYTFEFQYTGGNANTSIRLGTIVNNSNWAPTLTFRDTHVNLLNGGALADANLVFNNTSVYFNGTGGTSTISMNGGSLYYARSGTGANGENARLLLNNGARLSTANPSDGADFAFGSIEGNGTIDLTQSSTLTVGANNRNATFSGNIAGAADSLPRTVTKVGTGTWTLTGNNTTDAAFTVTGGVLAADANSRLANGGALTLDGGTFRYAAAFNDLRALVLGSNGGSLDTQAYSVTHSTGISGSGALTKIGSGSLTLDTANTYSGGTTLSVGTLVAGHDSALGTDTLRLAGGTLAASGTRSLGNAVTLSAASTVGGSSPLTFTGAWTLAGNHNLTVNNSATTTIAGAIGESGGPRVLIKDGSGTLELTGANTYTGGTLIAGGTVRINNATGSAFGTGGVTIASGATLTGAGSFAGALQNNGTYSPGNSPDLQTLSGFNQGSTGTLLMEIAGFDRGTGYDALDVAGTLAFGGALQVSFIDGFTGASLSSGATFNFFDWNSATGTFNSLSLPDLSAYGLAWDTSALYTSGELSVTTSAVPEPSTYALLAGAAALGLVVLRRRQARAHPSEV
jgi:autotransporter-associated beta strand protein